MDDLYKVLAICDQFNAIPLTGHCLLCDDTNCYKAALIKDCRIMEVDYPHESVLAFLCPLHCNEGSPDLLALREAVATLNPLDWKILND